MIDYVLWTTNQTKLAYVGHSQGVTAMLVLLSELPHYNEKISILHAMTSPVILKYNHPLVPQTIEQVDMVAVSTYFKQWISSIFREKLFIFITLLKIFDWLKSLFRSLSLTLFEGISSIKRDLRIGSPSQYGISWSYCQIMHDKSSQQAV